MISALSLRLMEEFERSAAEERQRKALLREELRFEADDVREHQRKKEEEEDREFWEAVESALATPQQVSEFNTRLESYDRMTVEALMENTHALDQVQERLDRLRGAAFVLPDGRWVFATTRGDETFDESGSHVSLDVVDPHSIPASSPKWEQYKAAVTEHTRLEQERSDLLAFQSKLDAAHERVIAGGLSTRDLDVLDGELKAGVPPSVASRLPHGLSEPPRTSPSPPSNEAATETSGVNRSPGFTSGYRP